MRQSQLFTKTVKETPADEVSKNAQLLLRAGFIHKEMAGVYSYLPLGLRVIKKIENIIREEMDAIGGQEIVMSSLQEKATWEPTDQWSDENVDIWFKTKLKNETELGLGWSHEGPVTKILKQFVNSYRDLPKALYQFQTKFRNETRAKSGIMRTREFVMKDMYSFSKDQAEHEQFYEKSKQAYMNVFRRVGLGNMTYLAFASGGVFSKYSHEFQTLTETGEDIIYVSEEKKIAINKEVYTDDVLAHLGLTKDELTEKRAVEVGNIFTLGTRFSDALDLSYVDEKGEKQAVFMGCYGIGPGRVMGTIVEALSDERGIVWPASVAPFSLHLISLCVTEADVAVANRVYKQLADAGIEVLFDDRADSRAGEKFADADLIGIPLRAVVSPKTIKNGQIEIKKRQSQTAECIPLDGVVKALEQLIRQR